MFARKLFVGSLLLVLGTFMIACAGTPAAPPAQPTTAPLPTTAPAAQLEKVSLAYGTPVSILGALPFDVAMALDMFKQEGLEVAVSYQPRIDANNALLAGSVDFAGLAIDQPILAQAQGKDLRMIQAFTRFPGLTLVVRSDMKDKIKTIADLKGQKINFGGLPGVMPYVIAKAGLKSDDVQFVEDGRNIGQIEADMEKGVGVVALLGDPFTTQLIKTGKAFGLVDLATESDSQKWVGGEYPNTGLVATGDTIKNRPQIAQKMTNALVKAMRYIATHTAVEIAGILPGSVTGKDKALFIQALQHSSAIFAKDGVITEAGVKNAIEINKALGAIKSDAQINAISLYTNDFVMNVR
jgi:NitT/TauT family transport system substrate-binding protein